MLIEVGEFCNRVRRALPYLVDQLQEETQRVNPLERQAWERSLPKLSTVLSDPSLRDYHLYLSEQGTLAVEYRLPASASWCDVVLLGKGEERPCAVILELKDWLVSGDRPGPRESLIEHFGTLLLHPSDQVRGYVDYCRNFHSAVLEENAEVHGCVLFTGEGSVEPYRQTPHNELVAEFPVFSFENDENDILPYLHERLKKTDTGFAIRFEEGVYKQDRNFIIQIADVIKDPTRTPFVLLDEQRRGYESCMQEIDRMLNSNSRPNQKRVIIIEGPPGSGKSVLAAHLWATLARDRRIEGNVVFTTTSGCQKSNWRHLYDQLRKGGKGIVIPTNRYNPGIARSWIDKRRASGYPTTVNEWRDNVQQYIESKGTRAPDDAFDVSVVDEAHALIDPTTPGAEGVNSSGWCMQAGPQAWHVIRSSRMSVFLMGSEQSYRDNETTSRSNIEKWAQEFGIEQVPVISLASSQFRCGGSKEYVNWIQFALGMPTDATPTTSWRVGRKKSKGRFLFEIVEDPEALCEALRLHLDRNSTARLVASYARAWATKNNTTNPHALPPEQQDFNIPYARSGQIRRWARIWNYAPGADYTMFIQATEGCRMHDDPLCEVGCPYVMRGFDYDYLGVLWLGDLVRRNDRWVANLDHVHETAWRNTKAAAKRGGGGEDPGLLNKIKRGYRILLSRAIKGIYVWFEDEETRSYIERLLAR